MTWDMTFYDDGSEKETVRGLSYGQAHVLASALDREGADAVAVEYKDGKRTGERIEVEP